MSTLTDSDVQFIQKLMPSQSVSRLIMVTREAQDKLCNCGIMTLRDLANMGPEAIDLFEFSDSDSKKLHDIYDILTHRNMAATA